MRASSKSLEPLAGSWSRAKNIERPSPNSVAARKRDLAIIATHLGDLLERPESRWATERHEAFTRALGRVRVSDLTAASMADATDALLNGSTAETLTRRAVDHLVRGWYRRAEVVAPKGTLAHSLRHTYATLLVDYGASLPEVQSLLGQRQPCDHSGVPRRDRPRT